MFADNRWLYFLRVPVAIASLTGCLALYSRFVLDMNLRNLRSSLSILDAATGVGQAEAALLLVDRALLTEMAQEESPLASIAQLQHIQATLAQDRVERPVEDAQAMLAIVGEDRAESRLPLLVTLDGVASAFQAAVQTAGLLPRWIGGDVVSTEIDEDRLRQALRLEMTGKLSEAALLYEQLIQDHPRYHRKSYLRLRLGYIREKTQDYAQAERLYREVLKETTSSQEAGIARQMLDQLAQSWRMRLLLPQKEAELQRMPPGPERQAAAFRLGALLIQIHEPEQAAGIFRQAFEADPEGELALNSLFREAWCLHRSGLTQKAITRFRELAEQHPESPWAAGAYLQMAEMSRSVGEFKEAAQMLEQASALSKDASLTAVIHASAANTYTYDLKDDAKASQHYQQLQQEFAASTLSSLQNKIQDTQVSKAELPSSTPLGAGALPKEGRLAPPVSQPLGAHSLSTDSPVVSWLESFLPVFVDVFGDLSTKYLKAAGEHALSRRFTEEEFRDLVVRQVQLRFPEQVSGIQAKITPEGYLGSANVRMGILSFPLEARIGVTVVDGKLHTQMHEVRVARIPIPKLVLQHLEARVNDNIKKSRSPIRVNRYELRQGYAVIDVELAEP